MSNGKYASFPQSVAAWWGKNRHRSRRSAAIHFHLLHIHQGSSAQLVVPARIGAPPSRCYDVARRACCDAVTRPQQSKGPPLHRHSPSTTKDPPPSSSKLHPLEPPPLPPETFSTSRDPPGTKTLPKTSRGPPRGGRRSRKSKEEGGGRGVRHFFYRRQLQSNLLKESHRSGKIA